MEYFFIILLIYLYVNEARDLREANTELERVQFKLINVYNFILNQKQNTDININYNIDKKIKNLIRLANDSGTTHAENSNAALAACKLLRNKI